MHCRKNENIPNFVLSPLCMVCVCVCVYVCVCVWIYIIPDSNYLSIFLSISKISSKEIKLLLFDSTFMLTWCKCSPKQTNTGNLQCYEVIFIFRLPQYFPWKTLQSSLPPIWFVLKQFWKTDFWTPLSLKDLNKNKPVLVKIRHEDMFALCLHAITITLLFNIMYPVSNLFLSLLRNGRNIVSS